LRRERNNWVSLAPANASRCTLFCIHHAGGGAAGFRNWPRLLGPSVQLGTVVLPGREALFDQRPLADFAMVVKRICSEIQPLTDKPYALFGHSLGAALAFEAACHLEQRAPRAPSCLIVSGRPALHLHDTATDNYSARGAGEPPASTLPDTEFIDLLRRVGGTPSEIFNNPEMMRLFLPVIRADFHLAENYHWDGQSRCACSILVLGGKTDRFARPEELVQWRDLTTGDVTVRTFDGGHFFIASREVEACGAIAAFLDQQIKGH
jgi:medium-chain acyl-[acyl-carrier-protein] hydrolase